MEIAAREPAAGGPQPSRVVAVAGGLLVIAATVGLIHLFGLLGAALPHRLQADPLAPFSLLALFAGAELLLVVGGLRLLERGRGKGPFPSRRGFSRWFLRGLAIGAVAGGWAPAVVSLTGHGWLAPMPPAGAAVRFAALVVVPLSAFWEEVVYRGILVPRFRRVGTLFALVLSSLAFAGLHFLAEPLYPERFLVLAGIGLVLGAAYLASGDLWFPIGLHCGINIVATIASSDPASGGLWRLVVVLPRGSYAALALGGIALAGLFALLLSRSVRRGGPDPSREGA